MAFPTTDPPAPTTTTPLWVPPLPGPVGDGDLARLAAVGVAASGPPLGQGEAGATDVASLPPDWPKAFAAALDATEVYGTPDPTRGDSATRLLDPNLLGEWRLVLNSAHAAGVMRVSKLWLGQPSRPDDSQLMVGSECTFEPSDPTPPVQQWCLATMTRQTARWVMTALEYMPAPSGDTE